MLHVIELIGGRTGVPGAAQRERRGARAGSVELCAHSQFLTDQIAAFPLLLDELLDERLFEATPTRAEFEQDLRARMAGAGADDPERQVDLLRQFQRAAVFRVAVPDLTGPAAADEGERPAHRHRRADRRGGAGARLAADRRAPRRAALRPGRGEPAPTPGMVVVAYGKFGGIELGYGSDLDLVFLHDSAGELQRTTRARRSWTTACSSCAWCSASCTC
ncbi:MAG: hypothetical protein MZV49_06020 [Rhodopseudomonas palustris]|nr:hypothetical protein [Rhodopseudomonas palustris]